MHAYVLAKGIKPHLDKWQNDLLAQWVPKYQNGKPLYEDGLPIYVQLAVRPVQIFEIGFPEEALSQVMNVLGTGDYILNRYPILNMGAKMLRKTMGLKPMPKPTAPNTFMQPHLGFKSVAVVPIGLKKDMFSDDGHEQL